MITDAELRALLLDCLHLWNVQAEVAVTDDGLRVGECLVRRATPPVRWIVQSPARTRAVPSVVALLSALRAAFGSPRGPSVIPAKAGIQS